MNICKHLQQAKTDVDPKTPEGCEECLKINDEWVNLRMCLTCGHVGCCNDSKNKHATKHYHKTKHPVITSFKPRESWKYCYVDDLTTG